MKSLGAVLRRLARRWLALLSWPNLCRLSGGLALVYVAAIAWSYAAPKAGDNLITGDYAAFYAAGSLLLQGDAGSLFDRDRVSTLQQLAFDGRAPDIYVAFRNPPFFAVLLLPFASLGLIPSFALWTAFAFGMLVVAVALMLRTLPAPRPRWQPVALVIAGFAPIFIGLVDGQNATLSLLLYVLVYRALTRGKDGEAGAWAALGLFKPQLFFVLPLVFVAGRRWRALRAYTLVTIALCLLSLLLVGVDGLLAWVRIIVDFEAGNAAKYLSRMHSLKAFWDLLLPDQTIAALTLAVICSVGLLGLLLRIWTRAARRDLPLCWALTMLVAVLIDPHLLDYDLSVLVLPGLLLLALLPEAPWWLLGFFVPTIAGAPLQIGEMNLQLTVVLLMAACGRIWWQLERNRAASVFDSPNASGHIGDLKETAYAAAA